MAGPRMIGTAEAQGIERRDRSRTHGEDVTQDTADACCRSLIWLDEGGVVMALHLENDGLAIADIDDARIFAWTLDDLRPFGRQRLQPLLRGFIRAVLVPHGGHDAELG